METVKKGWWLGQQDGNTRRATRGAHGHGTWCDRDRQGTDRKVALRPFHFTALAAWLRR